MIGLPEDWDEDEDEDIIFGTGGRATTVRSTPRRGIGRYSSAAAGASLLGVGSERGKVVNSKAAELLRRASEGCLGVGMRDEDGDELLDGTFWEPLDDEKAQAGQLLPVADVHEQEAIAVPSAISIEAPPTPQLCTAGADDEVGPLRGFLDVSVVDEYGWEGLAERTCAPALRTSLRGGLLAIPHHGPCGTFRMRLLRVTPTKLCPRPPNARSKPGSGCHAISLLRKASGNDDKGAIQGSVVGGNSPAFGTGVELLEAQFQLSFAQISGSGSPAVNDIPGCLDMTGDAQALLEAYCSKSGASLGRRAEESFELLNALFGVGSKSDGASPSGPPKWPPDTVASARQGARRLSTWLSRVNARAVDQHHAQGKQDARHVSKFHDLYSKAGAVGEANVGKRLKAAYHHLTANSLRRALRELNAAADENMMVDAGKASKHEAIYFDRLAAIVAACGGSSTPSADRRLALRRQLAEWRLQGVQELMGPALWRLYSLLAGDFSEIVCDTLEWRSAFGMYLWYRLPAPSSSLLTPEERLTAEKNFLLDVVHDFEDAVKKHGSACSFRPTPPHAVGQRLSWASGGSGNSTIARGIQSFPLSIASQPEAELYDMQYNVICSALGMLDWQELRHFDYMTHSPRPLDVACSWHLCSLLMALRGGSRCQAAKTVAFQKLTHQYCYVLELGGFWRWAVYVALFIADSRARRLLVRGLLERNAPEPDAAIQTTAPPMWIGVPLCWLRYGEARRCEALRDWPGAVTCWLRTGGVDGISDTERAQRATVIVAAFMQIPALLKHATAPFQRGPTEAILLAPMVPEARWLLGVLEELGQILNMHSDAWAELGRELLLFMRKWSQATVGQYRTSAEMSHIVTRCILARQYLLGL